VTGIQHPAPHLICAVNHRAESIQATAPYADTVYNGQRVYDFLAGDPQTRIWFMLYAQVLQADAASYRNVLLTHQLGVTLSNPAINPAPNPQHSFNRDPLAGVTFAQPAIEDLLTLLGLPATTPLSVLAIEILPGPLSVALTGPAGAAPKFAAAGAAPASVAEQEDPLGANLGLRRILRTSPLTAVPAIC
jgi:hypothetical protein